MIILFAIIYHWIGYAYISEIIQRHGIETGISSIIFENFSEMVYNYRMFLVGGVPVEAVHELPLQEI